jgi:hypothetical protein
MHVSVVLQQQLTILPISSDSLEWCEEQEKDYPLSDNPKSG